MLALVVSLCSAIALGIVTEAATGAISGGLRRIRARIDDRRSWAYDVRQDGLYCVGEWSPARTLRPEFLITETVPWDERPQQPYIDRRTLRQAVSVRSKKASGDTLYLAGFRIDHRESDETQYCRVRQAPSVYPEVLALEDLRIRQPDIFRECDNALARNAQDYLRNAVPSSIAVNLVVLSREHDELLCVERSAAVDSAVGWWTIGVFETMKQPDANRPGAPEDLFGLSIRGLSEELGLTSGDYGPIRITWLGILQSILRGHVVAVVKLKISKEEVLARARAAHSGYEHAQTAWLALRRPLIASFLKAPANRHPGKVGFTLDVKQRTWIDQSRLAVMEAWRFRNSLDD
jgi:hypothetical protein